MLVTENEAPVNQQNTGMKGLIHGSEENVRLWSGIIDKLPAGIKEKVVQTVQLKNQKVS